MQNKKNTQELMQILENVRGVAPKHCDICGTKYGEEDFQLIKRNGPQTVVHIKCQQCGGAYMLNIVNPHQGMIGSARSQINLDLNTSKELVSFAGSNPISQDQALDAYNSILKGMALESFLGKSEVPTKKVKSPSKEDKSDTL